MKHCRNGISIPITPNRRRVAVMMSLMAAVFFWGGVCYHYVLLNTFRGSLAYVEYVKISAEISVFRAQSVKTTLCKARCWRFKPSVDILYLLFWSETKNTDT